MRLSLAATAVAAALIAMPATADTFSGNNMNLVGNAVVLGNGDLQLTTNNAGQNGAAWLANGLSTTSSFSATFSFSLASPFVDGGEPVGTMADGISFAFQNINNTSAIGCAGGNIGYGCMGAVGSVVQTWFNNTAGLNIDGNPYNTQLAPTDLGFRALVTGTETVSYNASTSLLSMTGTLNVDGNLFNISDSVTINLNTQFGPNMYVGFTGATGASYADQRITSFEMTTAVPEPETYAMMLAGLGLLGFAARRRKNKSV